MNDLTKSLSGCLERESKATAQLQETQQKLEAAGEIHWTNNLADCFFRRRDWVGRNETEDHCERKRSGNSQNRGVRCYFLKPFSLASSHTGVGPSAIEWNAHSTGLIWFFSPPNPCFSWVVPRLSTKHRESTTPLPLFLTARKMTRFFSARNCLFTQENNRISAKLSARCNFLWDRVKMLAWRCNGRLRSFWAQKAGIPTRNGRKCCEASKIIKSCIGCLMWGGGFWAQEEGRAKRKYRR